MRQVILDTETTGIRAEDGHRVIEIGCIEMIDRKLTGKQFHTYLNPQRQIDAGAQAVHGITTDFLQDKPKFTEIVDEFVAFVTSAEIIIHNAPFDVSFINSEFSLTRQNLKTLEEYGSILDTLKLARQLHPGQRNSLDALCKRYKVDNSKRDLHGALLDAHLLANVYLAMTGGQGSFFESLGATSSGGGQNHDAKNHDPSQTQPQEKHTLLVLNANSTELEAHEQYIQSLRKQGKCLWKE